MGRLSDALCRELAADARRANQRAVKQLTANPMDGSLDRHLGKIRGNESKLRMERAKDFLSRHPRTLDEVGVIGRLQDEVAGLTYSEAEHVIQEMRPQSAPEEMPLGYDGEISRRDY